jgi:hypothetical protein
VSGSGTAQSRQRQEKDKANTKCPSASAIDEADHSPTLSSIPKPKASTESRTLPQSNRQRINTDSGLFYWRAMLGPEECGEQCLAQITSRLAQPWPENSEEAVKENLDTEYQVIKQLPYNSM